jgi:hypothetical protein
MSFGLPNDRCPHHLLKWFTQRASSTKLVYPMSFGHDVAYPMSIVNFIYRTGLPNGFGHIISKLAYPISIGHII